MPLRRAAFGPAKIPPNARHLALILPKRQRLTRGHHAELPYAELPAFMAELRTRDSIASLALQFCILTVARTNEVLGAEQSEIDEPEKIWTVPAERMKAAREHRVPLSDEALTILERLKLLKSKPFIFPGQKASKPLSNMALAMQLRRMKRADITVHGFRSSFRDWCGSRRISRVTWPNRRSLIH